MAKKSIFLLCAFLTIANAKVFAPRDLIDEIGKQLEELDSVVEGEILVAHGDLSRIQQNFEMFAVDVVGIGYISIQQEAAAISGQVASIKALANAAGIDASSCTNGPEDVLSGLPIHYINQSNQCINPIGFESGRITNDARYRVDTTISKVRQLEFQLLQCRGDFLCAAPLSTEISLSKIRLPQNIKTEVQAADLHLTTMRVSVEACPEDATAEYVANASSVVNDIEDCVNRLLEQIGG